MRIVYVLEGTLRYAAGGSETRDLGPGESMATPGGAVHGFRNPDIGAQFFRETGAIVNAGGHGAFTAW